jgi:ubiquinone/menaquinone biosynthesis C-methylase UbiE
MRCFLEVKTLSSILIENNSYVFCDDNGDKKVLYKVFDYLGNKSKVQMYDENSNNSLYYMLGEMSKKHETRFEYVSEEQAISYFVIDSIFMTNIIKASVPIKVLQLGCSNGEIAYHLTEMLGRINSQSTVCFVNNEINNNSNNTWLEAIGTVELKPEISLVISEYEKTNLEKESFDIIIINGEVDFDEPYKTIKEAERLVKKNGIIICYSCNNKNLKNAIKLIFVESDEYKVSEDESIFVINYDGTSWTADLNEHWYEDMREMQEELVKQFVSYPNLDICRKYNLEIKKYIKLAIANNNIKLKMNLIELKQNILDYMVHINDEYKEYYRNKIIANMEEYKL